jgi:hypothetical protein
LLDNLLANLVAHKAAWTLVGQFLGGFAVAFGAFVGGVIGWRRLAHERKQEDLRIVKPTMEEIEKYGQPVGVRFRENERKIGSFLTLIVGAVYTYILLKYTRSAPLSPLALTATVIFSWSGILSLTQGVFHPFWQISASTWHRWIWTASGVASIGAGTYVGVSAMETTESAYMEQMRQESKLDGSTAPVGPLIVRNLTDSSIVFECDNTDSTIAPPGTTSIPLAFGKHTCRASGPCGTLRDSIIISSGERLEITYWCERRH